VGEGIVETKHDKIMVLKANGNGYRGPVDSKTVTCQKARELCEMIEWRDGWVIKQKLHEIVSEYTPQETDYVL
jgi:hypothetical protein